jgi:hypothetical protein
MSSFTEGNEQKTFQSDLRREFENLQFADVVMVCEGQKVPAHRLILSMRSKVFAAMLGPNFVEGLFLFFVIIKTPFSKLCLKRS